MTVSDKEVLEQRLELFSTETWRGFVKELNDMADSLDTIVTVDTLEALHTRRGQVGILSMLINLEETTKYTLEQLDNEV